MDRANRVHVALVSTILTMLGLTLTGASVRTWPGELSVFGIGAGIGLVSIGVVVLLRYFNAGQTSGREK